MKEDFALASKAKWAKVKKSQGEEGRKNMDLMKVKCFHCHEHGHYSKNWRQRKSSKKELTIAATGEALASQFELDFSLIACMANTAMGGVWYLDSGASFHLTSNKDLFSVFEEK